MSKATNSKSDSNCNPVELARDLLNGGFSISAVMDALVAEGVERDRARAIISELHKARFERKLASSSEDRRWKAYMCMALGCVLFVVGSIWFSKYGWNIMFGRRVVARVWLVWGMLSAGFFTFLYGLHLRK